MCVNRMSCAVQFIVDGKAKYIRSEKIFGERFAFVPFVEIYSANDQISWLGDRNLINDR